MAVQAVRSRRSRRRAAGKKVIFPYFEQNLRAVRGRRTTAPIAIAREMTSTTTPRLNVKRSEYSMPLMDAAVYKDNFINVAAGNDLYFPALAAHAAEYQYFRFRGILLKYNPIQPTTEAGQVAIGVVPTWEAAEAIRNWDELVALTNTKVCNAYTDMQLFVTPSMMNTQVSEFKSVTPSSSIVYSDTLQNQGFIIVAIRGSPATATKQVGTLTVTYDCDLTKPRLDAISSPTNVWGGATSAPLYSGADHFADIESTGIATEPIFNIESPYRHRLLVYGRATTAGVFAGYPTLTAVGSCTAVSLGGSGVSADNASLLAMVIPDGTGDVSFDLAFPASTLDWTGFRIFVRGIGHSSFWENM